MRGLREATPGSDLGVPSEMGEQVTNSRAETDPELRRKISESGKIITIRMLNITSLLLTQWSSS